MKSILITLLSIALLTGFNDIATVNDLKKQAKQAYNSGDYERALSKYKMLTDSLGLDDESVIINLANTQYKLKDTTSAITNYSELLASNDKSIKTIAHQQLGIIKSKNKKFEVALNHFKESLKADPSNEDSRYNYELLKKILEEQKKNEEQNKDQQKDQDQQQNKDKNKDQQKDQDQQQNKDKKEQDQGQDKKEEENKDGEQKEDQEKSEEQKQEEKDKEGEEKKEEQKPDEKDGKPEDEKPSEMNPSLSEKLKDMKISEEKAKMILEAMKNNEIQYYQQNKRKAKKKKDPDKPDW